jgi:hypothetical protein
MVSDSGMAKIASALILITFSASPYLHAQDAQPKPETGIPLATKVLLDGVKSSTSRGVIKSVLRIECRKDNVKGTGFVIQKGALVTTNAHVISSCTAEELKGISSVSAEPVKFTTLKIDSNRDLAILCPSKPLPYSLVLGGDEHPEVETEVETWGYPLRYNDSAPILSRGYVAGYRLNVKRSENGESGTPVSRIIVNGALNPGNSGGPLIDKSTQKVIGVVVEKWFLFSPNIESVIKGLTQPGNIRLGAGDQMYIIDKNGERRRVDQQEGTAKALEELYQQSQVMVGEAISVSELNRFVAENLQALACGSPHN